MTKMLTMPDTPNCEHFGQLAERWGRLSGANSRVKHSLTYLLAVADR